MFVLSVSPDAQLSTSVSPSAGRLLTRPLEVSGRVSYSQGTNTMPAKQPNILILWGDDIGIWNCSYFSRGAMGYRTPNIDRVANEGVAFTDYYSQQSCTAGRACFICGQNPIRTGLTKVGMPGASVGLQKEDPTIAELLKPLGYATGQFGKNHLGDRNEYLPTVHGFDVFFGNLYHLNAEEEPELPDYPKDPKFKEMFGPRGVLDCVATDKDDATEEPRWGRVGKQKVKDTGPLTKKRMETIDEEITDRAIAWMEEQAKAQKPFFLWYNSTAMHFRTHVAEKNLGKSGQDPYSDRMVVHDEQIGQMLKKLDELGIADNTIVMYSTDNGPENDTWPDGANSPYRSQKDTNWEGGWRVPCFIRWPGKIKAGTVLNGIVSHIDMLPTLLAAAGDPDITQKLLKGTKVGDKTFNVHLDGYNQLPYLTGEAKESPRNWLGYFSDDGELIAVRVGDYKLAFAVQRADSTNVWAEPFVKLRLPHIFHLRRDPFERADFNSNKYWDWVMDHVPQLYLCQAIVAQQIASFAKFPPRQKPASFNLDEVLAKVSKKAS
jgi:arylsulfatase A-like enzyme